MISKFPSNTNHSVILFGFFCCCCNFRLILSPLFLQLHNNINGQKKKTLLHIIPVKKFTLVTWGPPSAITGPQG